MGGDITSIDYGLWSISLAPHSAFYHLKEPYCKRQEAGWWPRDEVAGV